MPLPKYLRRRGDAYYVRRALPLDVQAAFGRKEVWVSLRTASRREAEARSHAAIARITDEIEAKRRERRAASEERAFLASDRFGAALAAHAGAAQSLEGGGQPFVWHPELDFARFGTLGDQAPIQKKPSVATKSRASSSGMMTGPKSPGAAQASPRHHRTCTSSPSPVGRRRATWPPERRL